MVPVLVVGGAGYIGSHSCLDLSEHGFLPIVFDNLTNGHDEFVKWGPLEVGDIRDAGRLDAVLTKHRPQAIVHFAASIEVGQSVADPLAYYDNNVGGTISLLRAAERAGIDKLVFSSTCATYGLPQALPIAETHPQVPINPYGRSKLMIEEIIRDAAELRGLKAVILRYFNAAGADIHGRIGEWHEPETHAVPLAIETALGRRAGFTINGDDYDSRDGTCVRDYVHVLDLADAHTRAVRHLIEGGKTDAINLGSGSGTTVKELIETVSTVSGRAFPVSYGPRREGDAVSLVADNAKALAVLGWQPRHDLASIVETAWNWHSTSNRGGSR